MDDDIIVTLKRSNDLLMTFGNDYSDVFLPAIDEIERLREENRMYWTRYWNMAQAFERRGNALHRIASMRSDPEFGVPPIMTVQKIAQEALLKEKK
jgi:hypothetical protein